MTKLFQFSLDTGSVPRDWKDANVVPIFKKGDRHNPANYKPVSLTSVTCKLLEHIIHSNVMAHFDVHHILKDNQHGFRKRRSCESQLIVTIDTIAKHLAEGDQVDTILLSHNDMLVLLRYMTGTNWLDVWRMSLAIQIEVWIGQSILGRRSQGG